MRAVIDRIEGDMAVLLLGDEEHKINIPLKYLPEDTRESDIIEIDMRIDREATVNQKTKVQNIINKLSKK